MQFVLSIFAIVAGIAAIFAAFRLYGIQKTAGMTTQPTI